MWGIVVDLLLQTMMFLFPVDRLLFSTGSKMAARASPGPVSLQIFLVACLFQVIWLDANCVLSSLYFTVHNDKVESDLI